MSGIYGVAFGERERRATEDERSGIFDRLGETNSATLKVIDTKGAILGATVGTGCLGNIAEVTINDCSFVMAVYGNIYNLKDVVSGDRCTNYVDELLHLHAREGWKFIERLRGDFVLALWDGCAETLYLATDRFRVHPLFYARDGKRLVFASRLKWLLSSCRSKNRINPAAIVDIVGSSVIPTPRTIFLEVEKLPPGNILTFHAGTLQIAPYWDIEFRSVNGLSKAALTEQLKENFYEAISIRMAHDTKSRNIGTFLSGGVDSSTVTGVITQIREGAVKSFSIGFADEDFNELSYARIAAKAFGCVHYESFVTPTDVCSAIPMLVNGFDEPFANASAIPTYYCAKMAKEHGVDILYAGDGGDELFAGNERYATQRLFDYYQKIAPWLRNSLVTPLVFRLAGLFSWDVLTKAQKYIKRSNVPYPERLYSYGFLKNIEMPEWFDDKLLRALGNEYIPYAETRSHYFNAKAESELDRQLYVDLKLTISDNDLVKVSRMAEAAGIEVRYPFLDHRLAEFAARVPAQLKMRGLNLRSFFKNAYSDLLPQDIRSKKKHGFGLPIPVWLRTDRTLNEMMRDLVLGRRALERGYFRKKAIENLVERHRVDESTSFHGTILWNLMLLELWHRSMIDIGASPN